MRKKNKKTENKIIADTAEINMERSGTENPRKKRLIHLAIIFAVCLIAYSNTFKTPFIFDDSTILKSLYVMEPSQLLKKPDNEFVNVKLVAFISRPVVFITYALNYKIHGFTPAGFHVFNFFVHAGAAFLVYYVAILIFNTPLLINSSIAHNKHLIALSAALLFAAHPIQTQAVTYIAQRFTSLASFFYLLSFLMYIKFRSLATDGITSPFSSKKALLWYCGVIVSAILAYKSKEIAYTLPFSIILFDMIFYREQKKHRLIIYAPLLLSLLVFPLTLLIIKTVSITKTGSDYISLRAVGEYTDLSRLQYLYIQFVVLIKYLRMLFLPVGQTILHDQAMYRSFFNAPVLLSFAFLSVLFAAAIYFIRIADKKTAFQPLSIAGFAIFWFFITLSVESSIIPLYPIYEHRLYLPSSMFFIAVATAFFYIYERFFKHINLRLFAAAFAVILCALTAATFARNTVWASHKAFWADAKQKSKANRLPIVLLNLGEAYISEGLYEDAIRELTLSLSINPELANTHGALGRVYLKTGKYDIAIEHFKNALKIDPALPEAHLSIAEAYFKKGLSGMAVTHLETALQSLPTNPNIYQFLGYIYINAGKHEDAIKLFQRGIQLNPKEPVLYYNLGVAYASKGMFKEAIKPYQDAVALKEDYAEAHNNMGYAYAMLKKYDEAIVAFKKALQYLSPYPEAERNLSLAQKLRDKNR